MLRKKEKIKILIIDDEKDLCFVIKKNLEADERYKVITATNAIKGLIAARWHKPDLILLDIMMPVMDGFEVLKKIKTNRRTLSIPVIMLTARGDEESKVKAAGLYNEQYIVKPIETDALKAKIESVLSLRGKET